MLAVIPTHVSSVVVHTCVTGVKVTQRAESSADADGGVVGGRYEGFPLHHVTPQSHFSI